MQILGVGTDQWGFIHRTYL